jgi:hypothetical protein
MERMARLTINLGIASALFAICAATQTQAVAHERSGPSGDSGETVPGGPPCAVIEKFGGDLQILDATRTKLSDPSMGMPVGCGSWISVSKGWVALKHQGGALIRLGAGTFARLKDEKDPLVIHHGVAHLTAGHGRGTIRVITPNARVILNKGTAIVIYNNEEEESQVVALEDSATIENRFETHIPVEVKTGEGSDLNFKLLRVVPSAPRAVAVANVRKILLDLKLEGRSRDLAIAAVQRRMDRHLASATPKSERSPASDDKAREAKEQAVKSYARHPASVDDEFIRRTMARKVAGDERGGEAVLHPKSRYAGKRIKGAPKVETQDDDDGQKASQEEAQEKQRLIEELSRIKDEE